jgi:hypothetical protein
MSNFYLRRNTNVPNGKRNVAYGNSKNSALGTKPFSIRNKNVFQNLELNQTKSANRRTKDGQTRDGAGPEGPCFAGAYSSSYSTRFEEMRLRYAKVVKLDMYKGKVQSGRGGEPLLLTKLLYYSIFGTRIY